MPTVDRRLYLTDDGELVEHGDPAAAYLWAHEGKQVPSHEAEQVGYVPADTADDDKTPPEPSDGKVACPEEGCDYVGSERGLKIHTGQKH